MSTTINSSSTRGAARRPQPRDKRPAGRERGNASQYMDGEAASFEVMERAGGSQYWDGRYKRTAPPGDEKKCLATRDHGALPDIQLMNFINVIS